MKQDFIGRRQFEEGSGISWAPSSYLFLNLGAKSRQEPHVLHLSPQL